MGISTASLGKQARTFQTRIMNIPAIGPLIALTLVCLLFSSQTDRFLTGQNLSLVVQQVMVVGTLAIGQTLIILTSGIDLSVGNIMALGTIVMTSLAVNSGVDPLLAIVLGIVVCVIFGFINGALVTLIRLPPMIVTLGTLNVAYALTHIYSKEQTIQGLPPALLFFGNTFKIGGTAITYGSVLMFVLFIAAWFLLKYTTYGRYVYAVGDNPEATRLAGISTTRLLVGVYTIAGLFYGIAALLLVARTSVGDPQTGQNTNLETITAVVLGGTSLFGGRGLIMGTLIGALIIGILRNGLQLMGVDTIYQSLITGIILIAAVSVDQLTHRGNE